MQIQSFIFILFLFLFIQLHLSSVLNNIILGNTYRVIKNNNYSLRMHITITINRSTNTKHTLTRSTHTKHKHMYSNIKHDAVTIPRLRNIVQH